MAKIFFSYSHHDEPQRNQLDQHFSMLKREGLVSSWHDRRLLAGDDFATGIDSNLETADVILFLISSAFLASNYCFDIEMKRALERHERSEARVIPVILDSCDWRSAPFGKLLAMPRDGKPVSKYPNPNDAYLEVTQALRRILEENYKDETVELKSPAKETTNGLASTTQTIAPVQSIVRSSNLAVKQSFTDHDRDQFLLDSFEYLENFFEGKLIELEKRNPEIKTRYRKLDANTFTAEIYRDGKSVSGCTITIPQTGYSGRHSITYLGNASGEKNSYNEAVSIKDDGQQLGFSAMSMPMFSHRSSGQHLLSREGVAEHFWSALIQPLQ